MYIIQYLGYLAFSLSDNNLAFVLGKTGSKITPSALRHFSINLTCGEQIFFWGAAENHGPTRTCRAEFWHGLALLLSISYLPHCPCCQCRGSPWPRRILLLATLAGKHSASRFGPACTFHCCCTDQGTPLSRETKKGDTTDLSIYGFRIQDKQMRDTQGDRPSETAQRL